MFGPSIITPSLYGNGVYTGNIIQGGSALVPGGTGIVTVTGAATIAPDANTGSALAMLTELVVDAGSLMSTAACKGLVIVAKRRIELKNGGSISMTRKGLPGQVLAAPTLWDLIPPAWRTRVHKGKALALVLAATGAAGAAAATGGTKVGITGTTGGAWQSGGGGSGGIWNSGPSGAGAAGTPFVGGSGGAGECNGANNPATKNAAVDGGQGGYPTTDGGGGVGAGAGTPPGVGLGVGAATAESGAGGLILLIAPEIVIGSGCIVQADGAQGGASSYVGGGGSGGGIVGMVYRSAYTNNGTVRAAGGLGGLGTGGGSPNGGPGGAGSVNVTQRT